MVIVAVLVSDVLFAVAVIVISEFPEPEFRFEVNHTSELATDQSVFEVIPNDAVLLSAASVA